jgi:DNA-3-methyladenine glycosylase II
MNPAFSVILLTVLSGAAQGLVVLLALAFLAGAGVDAAFAAFASRAFAIALVLAAAALVASFFHLGRPDVLPVDDLGIRKGAQIVLGLKEMPKPKELIVLGERWAPYRTLASLYLWRIQDRPKESAKPVKRSQD